jgi:hypothetical protein
MMIVKSYHNKEHTRRLVVHRDETLGWDVSVEYDAEVVQQTHYADWHRVERARQRFDIAVPETDGWREVPVALD